MVFYTPLQLDKELMKYEEKLGLEFNGRKYDDIFTEISEECPYIYSDEELRRMCKENLHRIQEKYGFRGVRVWYHNAKQNLMLKSLTKDEDGWGGQDRLEMKYHRLIPHIWKFHNGLLFKSDHFLNYMRYFRLLEDVFEEEYGDLFEVKLSFDPPNPLYHILKTVHLSYYDKQVIEGLYDTIIEFLTLYGCKYYLSLDLKNPDNLADLYLHLAEESWDEDAYEGFTIFHSNDGWGNTLFDKWEHTHNEDGSTTSRLVNPVHTIDDYKMTGNVWD